MKKDHMKTDDSAIWRTFASPRTAYRLYGDPTTGKLIVLPPGGEAPGDSWREVPHLSAEKHVEIAGDFVGTLSTDLASRLKDQFKTTEWWLPFYDEVKRLGLVVQWNNFRREHILEQMRSVLAEIGVPATHLPNETTTVSRRPPIPSNLRGSSSTATDQGTAELRRIASAIVRNMSARDLRELPVRLGDVLDVLEL
jgi:hypothetical protein